MNAIRLAAFQDNIRSEIDDRGSISHNRMMKVVYTFRDHLHDKRLRHEVMDLLFNPAAMMATGYLVESTKNLSYPMTVLFFNTFLHPHDDMCLSTSGREFLEFLEALAVDRNQLKGLLATERIEITKGGMYPLCAYCDQPLKKRDYDMNEVVITRGDVMKWDPELITLIMVRENCVLVHHGDCHKQAHTRQGQIICIRHLSRYIPLRDMTTWINSLPFKSQMGEDAKRLLLEALK